MKERGESGAGLVPIEFRSTWLSAFLGWWVPLFSSLVVRRCFTTTTYLSLKRAVSRVESEMIRLVRVTL